MGLEDEDFNLEIAPKVQDYIFLIDRSGSMSGSPIQLAVEALKLFLHSLPIGSKFNVVSFGSNFEKLYEESVEYNEENLKNAVAKISTFTADMGGTELLDPLNDIVTKQG